MIFTWGLWSFTLFGDGKSQVKQMHSPFGSACPTTTGSTGYLLQRLNNTFCSEQLMRKQQWHLQDKHEIFMSKAEP